MATQSISIKVEPEVKERFNKIQKNFKTNGECFETMLNLLETEDLKATSSWSKESIENLQHYTSMINETFKSLINSSVSAEERIEKDYEQKFATYESTIDNLNSQIEAQKQEISELEKQNKELLEINDKINNELKESKLQLNTNRETNDKINQIISILSKPSEDFKG